MVNHSTTYAEINLSNIRHNYQLAANHVSPDCKVMAIIKADGYGHGSAEIAKYLSNEKNISFGVARLEEAITLREAGITADILILGFTPPEKTKMLAKYNLLQTVYDLDIAEKLNSEASKINKKISCHIKIDSGMGRIGFTTAKTAHEFATLSKTTDLKSLSNLEFTGCYTHFASSDSHSLTRAKAQLQIFKEALYFLKQNGFNFNCIHAANSAATMVMGDSHFDMVRFGISLYGLYPSNEVDKSILNLKPAMQVKTTLINIKKVPAKFSISYGHTYETNEESIIGTLSIGYADGFSRLFSSMGEVLIHGKRVPVVGRVCMDQIMVDISKIDNPQVGDEVVIMGSQGAESITADELASKLDTINYEIVSTIMPRVERIYTG